MRIVIAAAAFDGDGVYALKNAEAACHVASGQGCRLIVLPGCVWRQRDIARLSREAEGLAVCASCADEGGVIFFEGSLRLAQPPLYGAGERGDDVAIFELDGVSFALLAGEDARAPQAARLAALRGAQVLLCPEEEDPDDAGPWAQAQQNGLFAVTAPSRGEARILAPLSATVPDGVLARGRHGTMAIAQVSLLDWARIKLTDNPMGLLNRRFAASVPAEGTTARPPAAPLKVAAVQRTLDFRHGKAGLLARMDSLCGSAKREGCDLIAFPEFNWIDALGSVPFLPRDNGIVGDERAELDISDPLQLETFFPSISSTRSSFIAQVITRLAGEPLANLACSATARLARRYSMVVHGGTFWKKVRKKFYNMAVIGFADGTTMLQRELHPTRQETMMGFFSGEELAAFEVNGTMCCAPIGMDAAYYEPFAAARRMGCDVAVVPDFIAGSYYRPAMKRGAWARAIENAMYTVRPTLCGPLLGKMHTGHAGIFGPKCEPLALTVAPVGDELVVATLDFEDLRRCQTRLPRVNPALETTLRRLLITDETERIDRNSH